MKVLHIINVLSAGGRERRMVQLLKGLDDRDLNVSLIVLSDEDLFYKEVFDLGINVYILKDGSRCKKVKELVSIIADLKPNIVHCWCMNSVMLGGLLFSKIMHRFKLISGFVADGNRIKTNSFEYYTTKMSFIFSEAIVSNSLAGLKAKGAIMSKSHVIYNGFDYNRFESVKESSLLKQELGIKKKYVVSMFARFTSAKDWDSFIEVAKLMQEHDIQFLAVGGGDYLEKYKKISKELKVPNVSFLGLRNDVESLIHISDLTMLWSNNNEHAEGVSNSIMESMAAGIPVIASEGGGTSEIIQSSKNGFIVKPGDTQAAAHYIEELLSDTALYNKISTNAKKTIDNNFTLDKMVSDYIVLYHSLM